MKLGGKVDIVCREVSFADWASKSKRDDRRTFFLDRVEPAMVWVEVKMPRAITGW